jgi:hypothetical protein
VRYIVADKIGDAWVDGVYYDLSARALAGPGESLVFDDLPSQQATFFGLVTHVNDATLEDGVVVGLLTLTSTDGRVVTGDLVAGTDTAQGLNGPQSGNPGPKPVAATRENPPSQNYLLRVNLPERMSVSGIEVRYLLDKGTLEVRGGALLDETTGAQTALLPVAGLHTIHSGDVKIYENTECLPRAFLVHDFVVADDQTLLPALRAADLRTQAVLTEPPMGLTPTGVSQDQAAADSTELVEDHPERVTVRVNAASPGLLVLADSFYPGWKARVDGQSARILRANHMFRAVAVPAGQHAVTFTYQPSSYSRGRAVTFASLGVLVVLLAGPPFVRSRFVRARLPWRQKVSA